ncbi:hypothetical protein J4437_00495 [Candidatus Woesearchaeota archaeon]|nr:hypothetical protein [Candidatus Woesearchaeota archaeon]
MNKEICKKIVENKEKFIPALFTIKQINLIEKYLQTKSLSNSEKTTLYSTIKRKIEALQTLKEESYINGSNMIPERVEEAKKILIGLNQERAFISGSFLYKKKYNDIDIFVISRRRKSYTLAEKHFTFILESDLKRPIFVSAFKYSVANFQNSVKITKKRSKIEDTLFLYQWIISQIIQNEDQKEIRDLVLQYFMHLKNEILDARSLNLEVERIKAMSKEDRIKEINQITKELVLNTFSLKYLYNVFSKFTISVKEMGREYKTENIPILLQLAKEVQNECRRA